MRVALSGQIGMSGKAHTWCDGTEPARLGDGLSKALRAAGFQVVEEADASREIELRVALRFNREDTLELTVVRNGSVQDRVDASTNNICGEDMTKAIDAVVRRLNDDVKPK